jgi:hypothetical protein
MKEEILGLIDAIAAQDSQATQSALDSIMAQKTLNAMDSMRVEVAQNMFKTPQSEE